MRCTRSDRFGEKIAIILAYPKINKVIKELTKDKGYTIEVKICAFNEAVSAAKKCQEEGFDIIISRGASGYLIRKAVSIPVVLIDVTSFDIFRTIYKATKFNKKMAYFHSYYFKVYFDIRTIYDILGLSEEKFSVYYYENALELESKMKKAKSSGVELVVASGAFVEQLAQNYGMETIFLESTDEAVYNAFREAEALLHQQNNARNKTTLFYTLLESLGMGIMLMDSNGVIVYANDDIKQFLHADTKLIVGEKASQFKNVPLIELIDKTDGSYIRKFGSREIVVNKTTLIKNKNVLGTALIFKNQKTTQIMNEKVKQDLERSGLIAYYTFDDIMGNSQSIKDCIDKARCYSKSDSTVLITGESGVGKEIFASSIHNESLRSKGPFVAVNCASLSESLMESELFGYEGGAFTGARKSGKVGLFELANDGTIFLDEISEITSATQASLLRVLQQKVIRRIGGDKIIPVNVRIIAATNANLPKMVQCGDFREDLYFRINVLNLRIPPLRERKEDIPELIRYFLRRHGHSNKYNFIPEVFMEKLKNYSWLGNVRELENFVEKFCILSTDKHETFCILEQLYQEMLSIEKYIKAEPDDQVTVQVGTLKEMELQLISILEKRFGKNKSALASMLGICRSNLWSKLKEIEKYKQI